MYVTFNLFILEKHVVFFENSVFTLPLQPIKLRESNKSLITVKNYSTNISVEIKFYYPPGISRTQDPASRDEKNWARMLGFTKRRFHGRKVFSP